MSSLKPILQQLHEALGAARRLFKAAEVEALLPQTIEEAYQVGLADLYEDSVRAWKVGGANPWSQKVFANEVPFFGALLSDEVEIDTTTLCLDGLISPLGEPEVMLELAATPQLGVAPKFSRMALGFEIPASVLDEKSKGQLVGQIADRAGAGKLWIAKATAFDATKVQNLTVLFGKSGSPLIAGGSHNVIGGPVAAAMEAVRLALNYNAPIGAGQWIASGGLVPAISVSQGDTLVLETTIGGVSLSLV